jgi:hypothetical protein
VSEVLDALVTTSGVTIERDSKPFTSGNGSGVGAGTKSDVQT